MKNFIENIISNHSWVVFCLFIFIIILIIGFFDNIKAKNDYNYCQSVNINGLKAFLDSNEIISGDTADELIEQFILSCESKSDTYNNR